MLDFDVIGEDIAARHLFDMGQRAADMRPAMRKVRDMLIRGNAKQFSSHGSYLGTAWPPLAPTTLERKRGGAIGVRSGALEAAVKGGRGRRTSATRKQAVAGVSPKLFYSRMFAGGTKTGQPARPIVGANDAEIRTANFIMRRYITQGHA